MSNNRTRQNSYNRVDWEFRKMFHLLGKMSTPSSSNVSNYKDSSVLSIHRIGSKLRCGEMFRDEVLQEGQERSQ